ncbi:MAG: DUF177 domain-containing protein [Sphingomicrobium sp.]
MNIDFDCAVRLDQVRSGERIELVANSPQCDAIAARLGLPGIERLAAHATLERSGAVIRATGRLKSALTQECVVTGESIAAHVDAPFDLVFTPELAADSPDSEIELGPEDCDTVFYDGASFVLGEAIADTLALAVDPYPRSAGAEAALKNAGVMTEEQAGPFAALAALKGKPENES